MIVYLIIQLALLRTCTRPTLTLVSLLAVLLFPTSVTIQHAVRRHALWCRHPIARFSFASAAALLGLTPSDLDEGKSQISHGETVRETANMISFLTEVIGIRDDLFIHEGHEYQEMVAKAVQQGYEEKVLVQRPIIVNLQCDRDHPTQSMADLMHVSSLFGGLDKLKGKKIAMCWAYSPSYGKPLSVPQAIITLLPRFGCEVVLAHPEGYELLPDIVAEASKCAASGGGAFKQVKTMEEAFKDADVVYPKSWAPFWVMEKRVEVLRKVCILDDVM